MREYQLQTPHKDLAVVNRRSKPISDHRSKNGKKSLSSEFSAFVYESPKDETDFASITENSDQNLPGESAEGLSLDSLWLRPNVTDSSSPAPSLASETVALSDVTSLSSITTSAEHKEGIALTNQSRTAKSEVGKLSTVEAELVVKHLRGAQLQIINASGMDFKSKRVLDALVNLVVEEFIQLPKEEDWFNELMARKANFAVLSFLLWILIVSAVLFFFSGSQRSSSGAIPT